MFHKIIASIKSTIASVYLSIYHFMISWTLVPRILALSYMYIMYNVVMWFESIKQVYTTHIDINVLNALLSHNIPPLQSIHLSSYTVQLSSGPSTVQSILISALCGVAAVVFGFYMRTEYISIQKRHPGIKYPNRNDDSGDGDGGDSNNSDFGDNNNESSSSEASAPMSELDNILH